MSDVHVWISGAYDPQTRKKGEEWVTFAYGPWPDQESGDAVADNRELMLAALGTVAKDYEIDDVSEMTYGQACKHFVETLQSEHFEKLLPETHAAHLELMKRVVA